MNIIVCIKQVPDTEARIKLKDSGTGIVRDNLKFIINPYDEFALEEALLLREKQGGTVTTIALGPERTKEVLRTSLAVGADRAVHLMDPVFSGLDGRGVALALAAAIRKLDHDLIVVGKKAVGVDRGQVGAQVAFMLNCPFVSQVTSFETSDGKTMRVEREVEGGQEIFDVALPAVLAAEKTAHELRHASLKGIMQSKSKPIQLMSAADLGLTAETLAPRVRVRRMDYPPQRQAGRIISGDAAEAAKELVRLLHEEAKVI